MSLLDYGRQRSEIKTALSLTSFPLSWLLGHMRPSVELFEIAAYWNGKRGLDKLCLRHSLWAALEKAKLNRELHITATLLAELMLKVLKWWMAGFIY